MLRTLPIQNWFTFHSTIKNTEVVIFLTKLVVLKNVDLRPVWYYYLCKVRRERVNIVARDLRCDSMYSCRMNDLTIVCFVVVELYCSRIPGVYPKPANFIPITGPGPTTTAPPPSLSQLSPRKQD